MNMPQEDADKRMVRQTLRESCLVHNAGRVPSRWVNGAALPLAKIFQRIETHQLPVHQTPQKSLPISLCSGMVGSHLTLIITSIS